MDFIRGENMWMKFMRPKVWLPTVIGLLVAGVLFLIGESDDDAPGLVLIGLIAAIILVFWGLYNAANGVKKGLIPAIGSFCLVAFGVLWTIILAIEGEFSDSPGMLIFAALIWVGLTVVGCRLLKSRKTNGKKEGGGNDDVEM
jgi:hypothetical protein